jgi:hypothetical protein
MNPVPPHNLPHPPVSAEYTVKVVWMALCTSLAKVTCPLLSHHQSSVVGILLLTLGGRATWSGPPEWLWGALVSWSCRTKHHRLGDWPHNRPSSLPVLEARSPRLRCGWFSSWFPDSWLLAASKKPWVCLLSSPCKDTNPTTETPLHELIEP